MNHMVPKGFVWVLDATITLLWDYNIIRCCIHRIDEILTVILSVQ
jgi:hypothetical protein